MTNTIGRTFGVEIETVGLSEDEALHALARAGLSARTASYSNRDYSEWSIKGDASLESPTGEAAEVVSPVLTWGNPDHYRQVARTCAALRAAGARVNETCGLHVHIGVSDLSRTELVGVVKAYTAAQDSMNRNIAPERVGSGWGKVYPDWTDPTRRAYDGLSWDDLTSDFLARGYARDRYMTVNLMPYADRGTVEFRAHNGTLNPRRILSWAGLVMSLVKMGSEYEHMATWSPYTEAGAGRMGVYDFLRRYDSLDAHAEAFLTGSMAATPSPVPSSVAGVLAAQGV